METVKTINYRDHLIGIFQEEDYDFLIDDMKEDDDIFLVYYHRDFTIEKNGFNRSMFEDHQELHEIKKQYFLYPVYAYIHSGVSLSLSNSNYPYTCRWDTSFAGYVLIKRNEFKSKKQRDAAADGLIETWNYLLSGEVYGFNISFNDEMVDSCCGFIGDIDESGIIEECQSIIDHHVKNNKEKYAMQLALEM
jgi:hypothetical protein